MIRSSKFAQFFHRERRPGDLVFAIIFLLFAIFLLTQLGQETQWVKRTKLVAQPAFWPAVSLVGMVFFALLHYLGSVMSPQLPGRVPEVLLWLGSIEYAIWFLVYVWVVPRIGYLGATLLFTLLLTYRVGYRQRQMFIIAAAASVAIVLVFKSFLKVKIPSGQIYEYLPDGLRNFMLLYL